MSARKILVVDDDPQIRRVMRVMLTRQGYEVDDAKTGEAAIEKLSEDRFDLVLLDVGLPGMDGIETCRAIREGSDVPVIVLTVRDRDSDKVAALDAGADNYVTKPFNTPELLARIRAALRRTPWAQSGVGQMTLGSTTVDFDARRVTVGGRAHRLTPREFDVLRYFLAHPNKVLTHRELLQAVWGPGHNDCVDALRAVVHQLRKKIEPVPAEPQYLLTESWVGYSLRLVAQTTAQAVAQTRAS